MNKITSILITSLLIVALSATAFADKYACITIFVDSVVVIDANTVKAYFGYTNSSTDTIYVPNSSNEFTIAGMLDLNQPFIDLQYLYPGTHHTLYGPEFPADSGQVMWATFTNTQIIKVT